MNSQVSGPSNDPLYRVQTSSNEPTQGSADVEFQPLEITDILNSGHVVVQQFLSANRWGKKEYATDPHHPVLQLPDPDGGATITPFETTSQKAVNKFFRDMLHQQISLKAEKKGEPRPSPKTLVTHSNAIIHHILHKKPLNSNDQEIVHSATTQTQEAWSLPTSWTFGTQDVKDWTPIKSDPIPPVNLEISRREVLGENIEQLCISLEKAGEKVANSLPPDDPRRISVADFTRVIAEAIRDLKDILQHLQLQESQISEKLSKVKYDQIEDRQHQIEKIQKEQAKAAAARAKAAKKQKDTQLASIIVSAVIIAVAVVALPFTGGASSMLLMAGIAVSSVMLGYTIADSKYGLTEKAMVKFNEKMEDLFPDGATREFMKVLILTVAVLALVAAVACSGGAAAGSFAAKFGAEVAKQMVIQTTIMFIMSSNIAPELAVRALIQSGTIDEDDEKAKMVAEIVIMAFTMLACLTIISVGSKGLQSAGTSAKAAIASVGEMITNIGATLSKLFQTASTQGAKALMDELMVMINNLMKTLDQLARQSLNSMSEATKSAYNAVDKATKSLSSAVDSARASLNSGAQVAMDQIQAVYKQLALAWNDFQIAFVQGIDSIKQEMSNIGSTLSELYQTTSAQSQTTILQRLAQMVKDLENAANYIGQGLSTASQNAMQAFQEFMKSIQNFGSTISSSLASGGENAMDSIQVAFQKMSDSWKNFSASTWEEIGTATGESLAEVADSTKKALYRFMEQLTKLDAYAQENSTFYSGLREIATLKHMGEGDIGKISLQIQDMLRIGQSGVEAAGAIQVGLIGLQLVKILKDLGDLEKAQEVTKMMIKLFEKLLGSFQESLATKTEWLNSINRAIDSVYGSASTTLTKFTQQAIA